MAGPRLASPSIALDAPPWWPVFGRALEPWLVRGVDMGLAVALFLVPLAMGGRVAAGQLLLATAAMWVAACWCLRCCTMPRSSWSWSWAEPVILGAIGLIELQVVPLPPGVIKTLSPHLYEKLPLWSPDVDPQARLGIWSTLSLMPAATRSALIVLASYGILFLVTSQRVRTIQDVERLLRWVALAGSAMAVFGLLHTCSEREVLLVLQVSLFKQPSLPHGEFCQSESLRPVRGAGHRSVDLVALP